MLDHRQTPAEALSSKILRQRGSESRIAHVREAFGYLPPFKCYSLARARPFYICGKCFSKKGEGPYTNKAEMWIGAAPGSGTVPDDARCEECGGRAWPMD